eukprot:3357863-Pleurochrysis_carterae.AAC.1
MPAALTPETVHCRFRGWGEACFQSGDLAARQAARTAAASERARATASADVPLQRLSAFRQRRRVSASTTADATARCGVTQNALVRQAHTRKEEAEDGWRAAETSDRKSACAEIQGWREARKCQPRLMTRRCPKRIRRHMLRKVAQ